MQPVKALSPSSSTLAEKIGVDKAALEATVARYNELCLKGVDEDFGKPVPVHDPRGGK